MPRRDIIAIGGSLGAVSVVRELCSGLAPDLIASVFIVIHVASHGDNLLAALLQEDTGLPVSTATDGDRLEKGRIYIAPADHHMLVIDGTIRLGNGPRENMVRPAIDPLFRSVGISYGGRAIGVVLTGLLNDGAAGLADLKRCGGVTIVQGPRDAVAADMPLGALRTSSVDYRAPLSELGALLTTLMTEEAGPSPPVPDDIRLEVDIARGRQVTTDEIATIGDPVALSCPACGGVMSQVRDNKVLRFRCQVGHAYTADSLSTQQEDSVDEAMRIALRILEERRILLTKMARDATEHGQHQMARTLLTRAEECGRHAEVLRRSVLQGMARDGGKTSSGLT
ncbi:MAG: chemotaxis protein CheB [Acetobacteraceae bacterium]